MKEIYFDNAATTVVSAAALHAMANALTEAYGNPSSLHGKGVEAERILRDARQCFADALRVLPEEILFTSGGTESNNWAIFETAKARAYKGKTIITSPMEHPSVAEPLKELKKQGYTIIEMPVDHDGRMDVAALADAASEDVILVTMMAVNNEIGAVTPMEEIGKIVKAKCKNALYHVDAIQAFGKMPLLPKKWGVDLLSLSAHKFHGPKGVGVLYARKDALLHPLLYGGGQQNNLRSGTENVPGIAGAYTAAAEACAAMEEKCAHMRSLRDQLAKGLTELGAVVHGMGKDGAPHIVHAAFVGVGSEVLLHVLEDAGIYVSAGSACSSHKRSASPTLLAIEAPKEEIDASIRFSFSELNTSEEVEETLRVLAAEVPKLMRYQRK